MICAIYQTALPKIAGEKTLRASVAPPRPYSCRVNTTTARSLATSTSLDDLWARWAQHSSATGCTSRDAFMRFALEQTRPMPLIDQIPRAGRRGRPTHRPEGVPAGLWAQWIRNISIRGFEPTPEAFARWVAEHRVRSAMIAMRSPEQTPRSRPAQVVWVIVVHRKDLSPEVEKKWRRQIAMTRPGDPIYRIVLRGVQIRRIAR